MWKCAENGKWCDSKNEHTRARERVKEIEMNKENGKHLNVLQIKWTFGTCAVLPFDYAIHSRTALNKYTKIKYYVQIFT